MSAPAVAAVLVLGAIALAFWAGFVMGVQSGGRQAIAHVRAIAQRAAVRVRACDLVALGGGGRA